MSNHTLYRLLTYQLELLSLTFLQPKGRSHEHRFKNSKVQKNILQQRKPTNTGQVLLKITMPV